LSDTLLAGLALFSRANARPGQCDEEGYHACEPRNRFSAQDLGQVLDLI
jgi:hypothetical protein